MKEIIVYDQNGDSLNDLVQWDLDVMVYIRRPEITQEYPVHFFNKNSSEAYVVDGIYSEGVLKAKIPNILLRDDKVITGYVYVTEAGESKSVYGFCLQIKGRPKPSDIVFVDTKDWVNITEVLEECRDYADSASGSAEAAAKSQKASALSAENAGQSASDAADSARDAGSSAEAAKVSEQNADDSEKAAEKWKELAESHAHGGTGVREGEDTDNAKYWAEQAKATEEKVIEIAGGDIVLKSDVGKPGGVASLDDDGKIPMDQITGVVLTSEVGDPNGVASLDETGKIPSEQLPEISAQDVGAVPEDGDTAMNTVTFASGDEENPNAWTPVDVIKSGEKHSSLMVKISTMIKNARYLWKMLGSSDISNIGEGTVTSAIATLMADKLNKTDVVNDLLSTAADKALSAAMGKQLGDDVSKLNTDITSRFTWFDVIHQKAISVGKFVCATGVLNKENENAASTLAYIPDELVPEYNACGMFTMSYWGDIVKHAHCLVDISHKAIIAYYYNNGENTATVCTKGGTFAICWVSK